MGVFKIIFGKADKKNKTQASSEISQVENPPVDTGQVPPRPDVEESYWFFLSYFLEAKDIDKDRFIASWSEALGSPYKEVIKEFFSKGLIMQAGLKEKLGGMLRMSDLQPLLKEQGLSDSGKKDTLLRRYIEARPQEAELMASKMVGNFLVCTPEGRKEIKQHTNLRADSEDSAKHEMRRLLRRGKINQAAEVVNIYMKSVNRPPQDNSYQEDEVKMILEIKEVPGLTQTEVEKARINAAIELLWYGKLNSLYYSPIQSFHQFALSASIVIGKKRSQKELRGYSEQEFVNKVEIMCLDDSCRRCKAVAGRRYTLKNAPLLPVDAG